MNAVRELRELTGITQVELARLAGTSQPTIAAYESGSKSPTMRTVARLARAVGLDLVVSFVPPLTREDRRSLLLHRAVARRLRTDRDAALKVARRNIDLMWKRQPGARPLLAEWKRILDRSTPDIVAVLTDASVRARALRQVTPFAGVLTTAERVEVYNSFRRLEAA
jgi:transcriptional regulator with XRE-family HTH domain